MDRQTTKPLTPPELGASERTTSKSAPSHGADDNAYLGGNFAPMTSETTAFNLETRGRVPDELEGRLVRIGPSPIGRSGSDALPLVHGNGPGARPAPARRPRRVVPEPIHAERRRRRGLGQARDSRAG